ncbi:hypothetical protein RUMHYD_03637 [Blautia hydrogenotrophica DSM 10507]|uniref:Uncharacterized protein n=1 Tax=Blautia hydrogenotrophica (strain DSM 10507 / JCM 14656 / S5a33) TaxID=476272 RepID=C0CRX1_BLAHS|nr:hypothetical protein RUMHYD_03637 [Blautia hydrogenotrophica DSM 10507]
MYRAFLFLSSFFQDINSKKSLELFLIKSKPFLSYSKITIFFTFLFLSFRFPQLSSP